MAIGHMFLSLVEGPINLVEPPGKLMVEQKGGNTLRVPKQNHSCA
jgi:hypothetical protein